VLCELMNPDGTMARGEQVDDFALAHGIPTLTIGEIVHWRRHLEATGVAA